MSKALRLAMATATSAALFAAAPAFAEDAAVMVCKAGGKMIVRIASGGHATLVFTPAGAAAKDAEPGEGQCTWRDKAIGADEPKKIRATGAEFGLFLARSVLNGRKFQFMAQNNGAEFMVLTATDVPQQ